MVLISKVISVLLLFCFAFSLWIQRGIKVCWDCLDIYSPYPGDGPIQTIDLILFQRAVKPKQPPSQFVRSELLLAEIWAHCHSHSTESLLNASVQHFKQKLRR